MYHEKNPIDRWSNRSILMNYTHSRNAFSASDPVVDVVCHGGFIVSEDDAVVLISPFEQNGVVAMA